MNDVGKIDVFYIQNKYHIGFDYAQNVIYKLVEIGYIKKTDTTSYLLVQTEAIVDSYIRTHLDELRPKEYIEYGIKDNGNHTLKSKIEMNLSYYALVAPIFIRRLLFSIPEAILFLFVMYFLRYSEVDGHAPNIAEYIYLCIFFYIIIGIPCNIIIRILQCFIYKMKFKDLMLQPRNWFFLRLKQSYEISLLLQPNKKIVIPNTYNTTIFKLKCALNNKRALVEHYANIANTTTNENEFYTAINSCKDTLKWMSQFEKYNVFVDENTPSNDIKSIDEGMQSSINALHNRISNKTKNTHFAQTDPMLKVDSMEGHQFEYYCADILKKNGFSNVEVTQGSGDHGIDILADKEDISYAIQCKCYSSNIGNAAVQQAHTGKSLYHKDIAVVLTNQYFTAQAKEEADALGVKLWDRDKLQELTNNSQ